MRTCVYDDKIQCTAGPCVCVLQCARVHRQLGIKVKEASKIIYLHFFTGKTRWQRLRQFFCFVRIFNGQCVQISTASDLEFGACLSFGDFDGFGVFSAGLLQEIANVGDLFGLWGKESGNGKKKRRK